MMRYIKYIWLCVILCMTTMESVGQTDNVYIKEFFKDYEDLMQKGKELWDNRNMFAGDIELGCGFTDFHSFIYDYSIQASLGLKKYEKWYMGWGGGFIVDNKDDDAHNDDYIHSYRNKLTNERYISPYKYTTMFFMKFKVNLTRTRVHLFLEPKAGMATNFINYYGLYGSAFLGVRLHFENYKGVKTRHGLAAGIGCNFFSDFLKMPFDCHPGVRIDYEF